LFSFFETTLANLISVVSFGLEPIVNCCLVFINPENAFTSACKLFYDLPVHKKYHQGILVKQFKAGIFLFTIMSH